MKLTKACDYAFRLMVNLAEMDQDSVISIREASKRINIPKSFLGNIVQKLSTAGLVETTKGAKGGLRLKKDAFSITALDVYVAVEGPLELTTCQHEEGCVHESYCPVNPFMAKLRDQFVKLFSETTLIDIIANGSGQLWGGQSLFEAKSAQEPSVS